MPPKAYIMALAIFLTVAIKPLCGMVTDDEADAAFAELETLLADKQDIKNLLQEIKAEVTKKPEHAKNVYSMAKTLAGAVPKLKSDQGLTVAEGALAVIAGITEFFPPPAGLVISSLASLVSSILGFVTPAKTDKAIKDAMREVLNEARDKDLKIQIDGYRNKLTAIMRYLEPKKQQSLNSDDVSNIVRHVPSHTGVRDLSDLEGYIKERAVSSKSSEAKQAYKFCLLYVQIATFRDTVLQEAITLFRRAGDEDEAASFENVKLGNKDFYQGALQFLHQPAPEQAGAVVYYHPPGHSNDSRLIHTFMKVSGIPEPAVWIPSKYVLLSVKWPTYHIGRPIKKSKFNTVKRYKNYISFETGTPTNETKTQFIKRSDGYWELKLRGGYIYVDSAESPYYTKVTRTPPNDNELGHFVVIKYHRKNVVTISCRKWHDKFFNGADNVFSVVLKDGNTDNGVQFNLHDCLKKKDEDPGWNWYYCPKYEQ